jgi:uncharacterized protein YjgD (DUF1641 family)
MYEQNKPHIPSVRFSSIQKGVYNSSAKIFNQLLQNISKFHNNIRIFKNLLTNYLVKNALNSTEEYLCTDHA